VNPQIQDEQLLLEIAIARLRAGVMAVVIAATGGAGLFLATVWLLLLGTEPIGPHLSLLGHYLPGYTVSWTGAWIGLLYGTVIGAAAGWLLAWVYNRIAEARDRK
jgi:hypothetical protein